MTRLRHVPIYTAENGPIKTVLTPLAQGEWYVIQKIVEPIKGNMDPDTGEPFRAPEKESSNMSRVWKS